MHAFFENGFGGQNTQRLERLRIYIKNAIEIFLCIFTAAIAEKQLGVSFHGRCRVGINGKGTLQGTFIANHSGDANQRRYITAVNIQRFLIGALGIGGVVFLEKKITPQGKGLEVVRVGARRLVKQAVGIMKITEQPTGQGHHGNVFRSEYQAIVVTLYCLVEHIVGSFLVPAEFQQAAILCQGSYRGFTQAIVNGGKNLECLFRLSYQAHDLGQLRGQQRRIGVLLIVDSIGNDRHGRLIIAHHCIGLAGTDQPVFPVQTIGHLENLGRCCIGAVEHERFAAIERRLGASSAVQLRRHHSRHQHQHQPEDEISHFHGTHLHTHCSPDDSASNSPATRARSINSPSICCQ